MSELTNEQNIQLDSEQTSDQVSEQAETKKSGQKTTGNQFSDKTLNDAGISWMDMNHSVVIVGWGNDEKISKVRIMSC